ncbi:hypothetical protein JY651_47410 [Pyxidicoccus parkwayensis]|uniref:Lipoprotein n=1 Tax=Pyxidicoccus parkwayensis TaxID=2813578 RepID=A0ABX7NVC6_9BACT|nr:DUF6068 family protein [Pyxidicoccus parkwaysis]QSQ22653.1 hypothetical protein JY651_47410 [Pyxidicoccus parkwaysis]
MQMRYANVPLAALLGAALSFLPGCESTKSSSRSPSDSQESASMQSADAWKHARVGDRVTYSFSATQGPAPRGGGGTTRTIAGELTLEVVAVQQPWVWVRVAFTDASGRPLSQPRLAQDLVLPVRADTTRPLDVPHPGKATAETPSIAGRTWEALRYVSDQRPVDGPLRSSVYANTPGPLYLTHGLLESTTETAGFHTPGGFSLKLREVREGSADASAPVPALERPLGPGTYYDRYVDISPAPATVQRVCIAAERGYVLRTEGPVADVNAAPCSDFSQAEPEPLEELLMNLPWSVLSSGDWPPAAAASGTRGTFTAEGRSVPALIEQSTENVEGTERVFMQTYAADPWAPGLAGLAYEARFEPLASGNERVVAGGKRESEGGTRIVRWGSWLAGQK